MTVKSAKFGVEDFAYSNDLNYQLVDGKNFGNFVKPHLVTGPKKTYPFPVKNDPTDWRRWHNDNPDFDVNTSLLFRRNNEFLQTENRTENYSASIFEDYSKTKKGGPSVGDFENYSLTFGEVNQTFSKELKLAPKQTIEIEMPVEAAANLGVTFMANPSVAVSLVNEKEIVVGKNSAFRNFLNFC